MVDRLGSVRRSGTGESSTFNPYGDERTPLTSDGRTKFAGYYRDAIGQDYANARYYSATAGSFWSPDPDSTAEPQVAPVGATVADSSDPTSWNRFAYVGGDPINFIDPKGKFRCNPAVCGDDSGDDNSDQPSLGPGAEAPIYEPPLPKPVSDKVMQRELTSALQLAAKLLLKPGCASLFATPTSLGPSQDPELVLQNIANDFVFAAIPDPAPNTVTSATTQGTGNYQIPVDGGFLNLNTSVVITLNNTSQAASFVSGTAYDQAITLLHELGHVYWDLFGPGSSKIVDDAGSTQTSINNTNLIKANCK